ncbi:MULTISPECIES: hypothetical protein [unclassified Serratia (in: enterobacteria)]|uniref:hypothetical protein n=1 Tax=unclassified Serratia (in: enterobacteria) TaxID=2647522 RepID=UPI000502B0AD|nr:MULTISPECIES: hypothetical protein [unclassified Serratia (in: enterobacteria)]KFK97195.1 hypothetical protein JV45_02535 [Serratia sp. Ag2]KFK98587.1 hypothetical protein IV04_10395 [Serratia sp. Ag1]
MNTINGKQKARGKHLSTLGAIFSNLENLSVLVLFGLSSLMALLGRPAEMALAIVAGAIGLAFSNIDKLESFKGAGFEAKTRERRAQEAVISEQTNNTEELKTLASDITKAREAIMSALLNTEYNARYPSGIAEEANYPRDVVLEELNWLQQQKLVEKRAGKNGYLWSLTEKGMALLPIVVFGRKPL